MIRYQDRVVFGTDNAPDAGCYGQFYRLLETRDEYFTGSSGADPGPGRFPAYGLFLPDGVLEKVYHGNAERLLGA